MSLLDLLFPRTASAADIERVSRQFAVVRALPDDARLRRVCASPRSTAVCDAIHWSLWQDKKTGAVWVHCSGGIANVDVWYGPGDRSTATHLGTV
jgi:hypothetical protein